MNIQSIKARQRNFWIALQSLMIALACSVHAHLDHDESNDKSGLNFSHSAGVPAAKEQASRVSIAIEGSFRVIRANGLPDHPTGQFPNRNNPNRISPQDYDFRVPLNPQPAPQPTALHMQPFGIAVNGVVFDPFAAEWWNRDRNSAWQYEPMNIAGRLGADESNAHVQRQGAYHYHGIPLRLLSKSNDGKQNMILVGWAADGFPIYGPWCFANAKNANSLLRKMESSYRLKKGVRPDGPGGFYDGTFVADYEYVENAGDLDECNGRFGVTPEFPQGTYYYVLTENFPFIPRFFEGTPDQSFTRHGLHFGRRRPPG
jgi:hypothetical protein